MTKAIYQTQAQAAAAAAQRRSDLIHLQNWPEGVNIGRLKRAAIEHIQGTPAPSRNARALAELALHKSARCIYTLAVGGTADGMRLGPRRDGLSYACVGHSSCVAVHAFVLLAGQIRNEAYGDPHNAKREERAARWHAGEHYEAMAQMARDQLPRLEPYIRRLAALAVWDWDPETKWALSGDKPNVERVLDELALTVPDVRGELEEVAPELMHLLA